MQGCPTFFAKGYSRLWTGSRDAHVKITLSGTGQPNLPTLLSNLYSAHIIYKYGRGPHITTWKAACWIPMG